jgi:hypothetical protein
VPWNPIGAIVGPLGLISLFYSRKKRGNKAGVFLVLLLVLGSIGMTLAACGPQPLPTPVPQATAVPTDNNPPTNPSPTETPQPGLGTDTGNIPSSTPSPSTTPVPTSCLTPTITLTPTVIPTSLSTDLATVQWLQERYGVQLLNGSDNLDHIWDVRRAGNARRAVEDVANKISRVTGEDHFTAFRRAFDTYGENLVLVKVTSTTTITRDVVTGGGYTDGPHLIHFAWIDYPRDDSMRNNIVHELGHAFNQGRNFEPELGLPSNYPEDRNLFLHNNNDPGVMWQANDAPTTSETFADMFVAYTYDVWGDWSNPVNQQELRRHNSDESTWNPPQWMEDYMRNWLY